MGWFFLIVADVNRGGSWGGGEKGGDMQNDLTVK